MTLLNMNENVNAFPASRHYMLAGDRKCNHKGNLGNIRFHRQFTGFIFRDGQKVKF